MAAHRLEDWAPQHRAVAGPLAGDRVARYVVAAGLALVCLSIIAIYLLAFGRTPAGADPGRGVVPAPDGGFTTMADSMYAAPVIPGKQGARRPRVFGAQAAPFGSPGHLERLVLDAERRPVWTIADRFADADMIADWSVRRA